MSRNNQLPAGWEWKKLGEVLKVQNGYAFNSKLFTTEKGTPLIRIRDIKKGIGTETNFDGPYDHKYEVKAGDFLIGMDGEFGCYEWKGGTALLNQRVCRLQGFSNRLHPRFLFYGINKYLKAIEDVTAYATVKHISSKQIENIEIPLPPLPEQQRIVAFLDEAFAAIAQAKAHAEQNLQNAKALFESYLQGVFASKGSATGGGEWEEKKLQDVARVFGRGKSKYRPRNWAGLYGGDYPFIQTGDVRNANKFITNYSQTYNDVGLAQSKLWNKGTICITIAANIAETAILDFDACIPDSIIGFEVDDKKADLNFVYYLLQSFKSELQKLGKGSAQDNINLGTFENQYFPFPPLETQQTIVRQLDALRAETQRLEAVYRQKLEDLEELKKSVLAKAFRGELTEANLSN